MTPISPALFFTRKREKKKLPVKKCHLTPNGAKSARFPALYLFSDSKFDSQNSTEYTKQSDLTSNFVRRIQNIKNKKQSRLAGKTEDIEKWRKKTSSTHLK